LITPLSFTVYSSDRSFTLQFYTFNTRPVVVYLLIIFCEPLVLFNG
jgi:hypothetical protein